MTYALDASVRALAAAIGDDMGEVKPNVRKANFTADRAPLPSDDETQGYAPGSRWLWQGREWVLADGQWQEVTRFDVESLAALLVSLRNYPIGSIVTTRAEGFSYEAVSSAPDLTTSGGVMLRVLPREGKYTPQMFGAVADASWSETAYAPLALPGGFVGSDATEIIAKAMSAAASRGASLHFPAGNYLIARQPPANKGLVEIPARGISITADDGAELWIDFDPNLTYGAMDLFRSPGEPVQGYSAHGPVSIEGLTFRSLWSHYPSGGGSNGKVHILGLHNHTSLTLRNVKAFDICGKFGRSRRIGSVHVTGCQFERIASDAIRFIDCPDVRVTDNVLTHVDDDCIALHTYGGIPVRDGIVITGNQLTDCETVLVLGARNAVVSNNTMRRSKAAALYIGGRGNLEGDHTSFNIVVTNNVVLDPITRYDGAALMQATSIHCAIAAGGTVTSGQSTDAEVGAAFGGVVQPYVDWDTNSNLITYNEGSASNTIPPTANVVVSGNTVLRTLPNVAKYSDWGFGPMFWHDGWVDPAVGEENRLTHGVGLMGTTWGASVFGNVVRGCKSGAAIFLNANASPNKDVAFRSVSIYGNVGVDCCWGVSHSQYLAAPSEPHPWGLHLADNVFDLDPECSHPSRAAAGAWNVDASTTVAPSAYMLRNVTGTVLRGGVVSNTFTVLVTNGSDTSLHCDARDVTVYCDPVAPGLNAGNKGVAHPEAGSRFRHIIAGCDPTAADWRKIKNHCRDVSETAPTTGKYVAGHVVTKRTVGYDAGTASVVTGWLRLTTGENHVVGSGGDWWPIRAKS